MTDQTRRAEQIAETATIREHAAVAEECAIAASEMWGAGDEGGALWCVARAYQAAAEAMQDAKNDEHEAMAKAALADARKAAASIT